MSSLKTIEQPKRLDKSRKLLIKELYNNIAKQSLMTPKRKPSQENDGYQDFETLKKKQHLDVSYQYFNKKLEKTDRLTR